MRQGRSKSPGENDRPLIHTGTWVVAVICTVFIVASLLLEKAIQILAQLVLKKSSIKNAVDKMKAELMILGVISLLLNFGEYWLLGICIPKELAGFMPPCERKLIPYTYPSRCMKVDHEPLTSRSALHQLHILIFSMATAHTHYSFVVITLGRHRIGGWKKWEQESASHDPSRPRLTHETSFVRKHSGFWTQNPVFFYVGCFIQQFLGSVEKTDYLTLRHGFVETHLVPGEKFDFYKYIRRSLEDDFELLVAISPLLWGSVVASLLLNNYASKTMYWASFIPIMIVLAVGTKLQAILTSMALEITERHSVVQGMPLVHTSDNYFWLKNPSLLLHLLHFALFQTSFQIAFSLWDWKQGSCVHKLDHVILKLCLGLLALILCSYITLPLYALVTQMGSHMKKAVFDEHLAVRNKKDKAIIPPTETLGVAPSASRAALFHLNTTGHMMSGYEDQTTFGDEPDQTIVSIVDEITEL